MLKDARPRKTSFLRHMTDDKDGDTRIFRNTHHLHRALAYLRDAAGRTLDVGAVHGLDRVDDEERGLLPVHMGADRIEVRLTDNEQLVRNRLQTVCTHTDLTRTLLTCHIEYAMSSTRNIR